MAILCGCAENEIVNTNDKFVVTGKLHSSRTAYHSENGVTKVTWVKGDEISLFTKDSRNLKYSAEQSGEETIFSGTIFDVTEGDSIWALYPYDAYIDENKLKFSELTSGKLPIVDYQYNWQHHNRGLSAYDYMFSRGVVKNNKVDLQFEHIFAILKITFPVKMIKDDTTIRIHSSENISFSSEIQYNMKTKEFSGNLLKQFQCVIDKDSLQGEEVTINLAILPQSESAVIDIKSWYLNTFNLNTLYSGKVPQGGMKAGYVYHLNLKMGNFTDRKEKDLKALKALYESTGGNNWTNNTNWFSDEPLYKWYGLHNGEDLLGENIRFDYTASLNLSKNNLKGTLPAEFTHFMDNLSDIDLSANGLVGKIPQEILEHPRWNEIGWNVILQDRWIGGGFDFSEGSHLYLDDFEAEYLTGEKAMFLDILSKNKISLLLKDNPKDVYTNLLLSYRNKGFGIITLNSDSRESAIENSNLYPIKEGITRIWENKNFTSSPLRAGMGAIGSYYLLDDKGSVIDYYRMNFGLPESFYSDKIDSVLHARLGEPEDHPPFTTEYYTSTDYSKNGEVVTLQKATVGKGIDLVLLGDGFVDKEMESNGVYEQYMKNEVNKLFEYEPYKSLRDRFNIYTVKAISATAEFADPNLENKVFWGASDSDILEYAKKVPNLDESEMHVALLIRADDFPTKERSYCLMYDDGSFIAMLYNYEDDLFFDTSSAFTHEVGGHGLAFLLDEYVESGYENLIYPDELRDYLDNEWSQYGRGANVDWRNDRNIIKWQHFLNDGRYSNEGLGIYEGANLYGYGIYRPNEESVMRNSGNSSFNAPSREQIYKRIMRLSEGEEWKYDYETFVKFDENGRNAVSRSVTKPLTDVERRNYIKNHRPPTIIKGTWRDAMKNGKTKLVVPFR